jgi:hypothetical protein
MTTDKNTTPQNTSWLYVLMYFVGTLLLVAGIIALFIYFTMYSHSAYGFQIASLIAYTAVVVWQTFFRQRYARAYSFSHPAVRSVLPKLCIIHAEFLCLAWIAVTAMLYYRTRVPQSWLENTGPKGVPPYDSLCIVFAIAICTVQVVISRRILSRSLIAWVEK